MYSLRGGFLIRPLTIALALGCAGALFLSSYLIPVFGFWRTAWLCAAINLLPALLAVRAQLQVDGVPGISL